MYRAVVLTTLVLLLVAVAGVSIAQEGRIFAGGPDSNDPPESTTQEQTSFEATGPEATTASPLPDTSSETEDPQNVPEPTVGKPEKSTAPPGDEETTTPGTDDAGKPEPTGKASEHVAGSAEIGQHGNAEPVERGNKEEPGRGAGRQKATLCHKGNKTLTVGAPALAAHLRHGDTRGACQGDVSGPEPSGEVMGPGTPTNGEGGGQDKVVLCHKNKTLTVGAPAQAAHMRHGDRPGACR